MDIEFDVVIVGGGMVGMALAQALSKTELKLLLIDAGTLEPQPMPGQSGFEPRVSAINPKSQQWLQTLGVWQRISPSAIQPFDRVIAWDAEGTGQVSFSAEQLGIGQLGHIVENIQVQAALMDALSQGSVEILRHSRLVAAEAITEPDAPEGAHHLRLDNGRTLTCKLLVGADGHQSVVRQLGGFKVREWPYNHQAIVTTITTEKSHDATARQAFATQGPLGVLPLPGKDQKHCSIVWSQTTAQANRLMALPEEAFCAELGLAMEYRLGRVVAVDRRFAIDLQAQIAESLVGSGMALVGDAAHRIHPLAGQGANLGFADAEALTQTLLRAHNKALPVGSLLSLRRYQRQRQSHNLAMTAAMEGFKRLFEADNLAIRWLRNTGMTHFDSLPGFKSLVMTLAMGQGPEQGQR